MYDIKAIGKKRMGNKNLGKKIKTLKNGVGKDYEVLGNFIHPCIFSAMTHQDSLTRVNSHLDNVLAQGAEILGNVEAPLIRVLLGAPDSRLLDYWTDFPMGLYVTKIDK